MGVLTTDVFILRNVHAIPLNVILLSWSNRRTNTTDHSNVMRDLKVRIKPVNHVQSDTKKRELLKCVVAVKECIRGGGRHLQDVIFKH